MSGFDRTTQSPLTGRVLAGRYRLVSLIARGGMAEVWEGYDEVLSRPVAVKVLRIDLAADEVFRERFRREAITAARLAHPGIVATFDTGVDDGTAFIVMELVRGRNLRQLLDQQGRLDLGRATSIASQVADALSHSHHAGLVHRDVKPANVLLLEDGSYGPRVKVTDFGIAKAAMGDGADLTRTGMVLGTPKYLSPEQIRGADPDARADLYALGVVLYEMLTGEPPFVGDNDMATALAHLSERVPKPSSVVKAIPPKLDRLVVDLLAKTPTKRSQTADEVRDRLDGLGLVPTRMLVEPGRTLDPARFLGRRRDHTPRGEYVPGDWAGLSADGSRTAPGRPRPSYDLGAYGRNGRNGTSPEATRAGPVPEATRAGPVPEANGAGLPEATRVAPSFGDSTAEQHVPDDHRYDPLAGVPVEDRTDQFEIGNRPGRTGPTGPIDDRRGAAKRGESGRSHPRRYLRRERAAGLVVLALVVIGIVISASLLSAGGKGKSPSSSATSGVAAPIDSVSVYMVDDRPPDDPGQTSLTFDGNPATFWSTDQYHTPTFSGLYPGIGLSIRLRSSAALSRLSVRSATSGWAASVYVSSTPVASAQNVTAWGRPTDSKSSISGDVTFALGGRRGQYVLLWITNLGPADRAEVAELAVTAG